MKKRDVILLLLVGFFLVTAMLLSLTNSSRQKSLENYAVARKAVIESMEFKKSEPASSTEDSESSEPVKFDSKPKLKRLPTKDDTINFQPSITGVGVVLTKAYIGALKRFESAVWNVNPDAANKFNIEIGLQARLIGDVETARKHYWEALKRERQPEKRNRICGYLAWLEEDTRVAEMLLEKSCDDDDTNALIKAIFIAARTGSDELQDYYFQRLEKANPEHAEEIEKRFDRNRKRNKTH